MAPVAAARGGKIDCAGGVPRGGKRVVECAGGAERHILAGDYWGGAEYSSGDETGSEKEGAGGSFGGGCGIVTGGAGESGFSGALGTPFGVAIDWGEVGGGRWGGAVLGGV